VDNGLAGMDTNAITVRAPGGGVFHLAGTATTGLRLTGGDVLVDLR
jgi:hypothetical protein